MADRQTRNVSLSPQQDAFVDALVASGRFRTVSEAVREGLRLLEEVEHRQLLEKWIYSGLSEEEQAQLPQEVKDKATNYFRRLVEEARDDVRSGRVSDGPSAMKRVRDRLQARR